MELRTTWNVVSEFELICGIEDLESSEFELICGIEDLEWIIELELICRIKEDLEWSEFVESRTWNRSTEWGTSRGRTYMVSTSRATFSFLFSLCFSFSFLVATVCVSLFIGCEILLYCQNLKFFCYKFNDFFEFFFKLKKIILTNFIFNFARFLCMVPVRSPNFFQDV